jgi:subtilisin family serine protease
VSGDATGTVPVDVYLIDSGITSEDVHVVEAIDFRGTDDPSDADGHGTHVAGTIAAIDDEDGVVGIAPGANVHNLRVLDENGSADVSVVIAAMEHVIAARRVQPTRPMVVNLSIGENIGSADFTALDLVVDRAVSVGIVVVVAAGNQGVDATLVTPAHVPSALTVGAFDAAGGFAPFSNHGPFVDLLAPGVDVVSIQPGDRDRKARMSGTSMAAPHVAGAAALYLSRHPEATPDEVRQALLDASHGPVHFVPPGTTSRSVWVGGF